MTTKEQPKKKRKISKEEIATRQLLLERQEKYYQDKLKSAKRKINRLLQENTELKASIEADKQNRVIQSELAQKRKTDAHNALVNRLNRQVIDCTTKYNSQRNIGFSKAKDKDGITGRELKITIIDGVPCKSARHIVEPSEPKIVIETKRDKDTFCLSFCSSCFQAFIKGLKSVDKSNRYYYDDEKEIEIIFTESFSGQQCFSCYKNDNPCYSIRIGNIAFKLCSDCRACWLMQLEGIERKIKRVK